MKYHKWFILLGNNNQDSFDLNLTQEKQNNIVRQLKQQKWDKVYHDSGKHYCLNDMKYIITSRGKHLCHKTKVSSYERQTNVIIGQVNTIPIPIEQFPPITEYHDMFVMERTVLIRDSMQIHIRTINHNDKSVSFEVRMEGNDKEQLMKLSEELGYKVDDPQMTEINHGARIVMSVI